MRVKSFDSLRGIGALVVVISHCALVSAALPRWIFRFPVSIAFGGEGFVLVFFALSGFVLFHSFRDNASGKYIPYNIKRFVRIYPPFVAAVLCSAVIYELIEPRAIPSLTDWFNGSSWQLPLTAWVILGHFIFTDLKSLQGLDNVMWSLAQETRLSLIYPLIAFCVLRNWQAALVGSFIVSILSMAIESSTTITWAFDPFLTLSYLFLFTAGATLAHMAEPIKHVFGRIPPWVHIVLWIAAFRLLTVPVEQCYAIITSAAALLILTLCFATRSADRVLSAAVLRWLGRVSYSLYLVHLPIILTYVHLFYGKVALPTLLTVAVLSALAAAEVMYRLVEQPAITMGRRLSARWAAKPRSARPGQLVDTLT